MKKQKGYSLVELLVALAILSIVMAQLGSLMVSSQKIYQNGLFEVNLQENSQQVLQVVSDLMANTTDSIDHTPYVHKDSTDPDGIVSDVITIKTDVMMLDSSGEPKISGGETVYEEVTYEIGLACDILGDGVTLPNGTVSKDPGSLGNEDHEFDTLIMRKSVTGVTEPDILIISEDVQSIRIFSGSEEDESHAATTDDGGVIMDQQSLRPDAAPAPGPGPTPHTESFKIGYSSDHLTLQIVMHNQKYTYTASNDVYLRNQIGSGGPAEESTVTSHYQADIIVLRGHTFKLKDYVPADYIYFMWEDYDAGNAYYTLSGTAVSPSPEGTPAEDAVPQHVFKDGKLCANSTLNGNWSKEIKEVYLLCSTSATMSNPYKILIHTDPVSYSDMPLFVYTTTSAPAVSCFPVKGLCICPDCVQKHTMEWQLQITLPGAGHPWNDVTLINDGGTTVNHLNIAYFKQFDKDNKYKPLHMENNTGIPSNAFDNTAFAGDGSATTAVTGDELEMGSAALYVLTPDDKMYCIIKQCDAKWTYGNYTDPRVNAITLTTSNHPTATDSYWNAVVGAGDGYIRVRINVELKNDELKYDNIEFYGYLYPQETGTDEQHQDIWQEISAGTHTY